MMACLVCLRLQSFSDRLLDSQVEPQVSRPKTLSRLPSNENDSLYKLWTKVLLGGGVEGDVWKAS